MRPSYSLPQHSRVADSSASYYATVLHQLRLVHTDLKPENILLVSARSDEVRTTGAAAVRPTLLFGAT